MTQQAPAADRPPALFVAMRLVTALNRDCRQRFGPTPLPPGVCAAVPVGGVRVALIRERTEGSGVELIGNLGIKPTDRKLVVAQSTNHVMAAFGPIAGKVIYLDADGRLGRDDRRFRTPACSGCGHDAGAATRATTLLMVGVVPAGVVWPGQGRPQGAEFIPVQGTASSSP